MAVSYGEFGHVPFIRALIDLSNHYYTPLPKEHKKCIPGECVMNGPGPIYVCSSNSRNIHVCNETCGYAIEDKKEDTVICDLTGRIIHQHRTLQETLMPVKKTRNVSTDVLTVTRMSTILTVLREIIDFTVSQSTKTISKRIFHDLDADARNLTNLCDFKSALIAAQKIHADAFPRAVSDMKECTEALMRCIYQVRQFVSGESSPTSRRLVFFTICSFFFFRSGALIDGMFPRITAFAYAPYKLAVITRLTAAFPEYMFSSSSITTFQKRLQIMLNELHVKSKEIIVLLVNKYMAPWLSVPAQVPLKDYDPGAPTMTTAKQLPEPVGLRYAEEGQAEADATTGVDDDLLEDTPAFRELGNLLTDDMIDQLPDEYKDLFAPDLCSAAVAPRLLKRKKKTSILHTIMDVDGEEEPAADGGDDDEDGDTGTTDYTDDDESDREIAIHGTAATAAAAAAAPVATLVKSTTTTAASRYASKRQRSGAIRGNAAKEMLVNVGVARPRSFIRDGNELTEGDRARLLAEERDHFLQFGGKHAPRGDGPEPRGAANDGWTYLDT